MTPWKRLGLSTCVFLGFSQMAMANCLPEKIYLTRHAEKLHLKGERDPDLSEQGKARAQRIAAMFAKIKVDHLFSTDYKRTQQTLMPLSRVKNLVITSYDPRQGDDFIKQIKTNYCQQSVLIAGHSNTVPNMLQALGITFEVKLGDYSFKHQPSIVLSEAEFGQLFVVSFHNNKAEVQVLSTNG
ncbi:phosphoglycerate mutase family protein [uncultured Shewanella sp.]|uniref:phosphoglycerate mutase family protein n=1 Tax=uncultured Shewanella sp. TaxID=173975 RepID=UPI00261A816F|nr:phosphoglycerate mutase family protein [uncultured Shewanella sp.]